MRDLLRGRGAYAAGLAITLAAAAALVAQQPLTSSWARYADADAAYAGSGISIAAGERTKYLDHPGLPLQQLFAVTFDADYLTHKVTGDSRSLRAYAGDTMLHLDRMRALFRGWAVLFYLAGAVAAFFVTARLLGSALLATAAGLAWLAAPGLGPMSIQYRPDVLLAALCLLVAYLIASGGERSSAARLGLAALLLGFTLTVKIHAAGLVFPLALAAVVRHPAAGWWPPLRDRAVAVASRRRLWLAAAAVVWLGLIAALNVAAWPFGPAPAQRVLVAEIVAALGLYWLGAAAALRVRRARWARRLLDPFYGFLATALAAGIALPLTLSISDAGLVLQAMKNSLEGNGVNKDVPLFHWARLNIEAVPRERLLLLAAFAVATVVLAARRRRFWPVALLLGAGMLTLMAIGREAPSHYYAPGFVVALPVALWLFAETTRWLRLVPAAGAAALAVGALWTPATFQERGTECASSAEKVARLLQPGEVALAAPHLQIPDFLYQSIVKVYVNFVPELPIRFLSLTSDGIATAARRGLHPRYVVGPIAAGVRSPTTLRLGELGERRVRPVYRDDGCGAVELVT